MMMYDTLLARSFSKHEQKKLGYGAMVACVLIVLSFCTVFKPYLGPLPILNLRLSMEASHDKLQLVNETSSTPLTTKNAEPVTKNTSANGTSSSLTDSEIVVKNYETTNRTDSSSQIASDAERVTNRTVMINMTSSSWNKAEGVEAVTKNLQSSFNDTSSSQKVENDADVVTRNNILEIICNTSSVRSDFCDVKGDIRVDGNSATVFIVSSESEISAAANTSWSIRPYARKGDMAAMSLVREWKVKIVSDNQDIPQCTRSHNVPAILFSLGGYSGNHFHSFTDIIVPLYATARPFDREVKFLMTDIQPRWIRKFETILKALSGYEFIDIDKKNDGIHCFDSIVVGLKHRSSRELSIDPSNSPYTVKDLREFLRSSYQLKKTTAIKVKNARKKRPQLLIISRKWSRAFTNVNEIARMAKRLGYKVVVAEPDSDIAKSAQIMNSCDVVMGVHGAGLTNILFLPENAILIQVIPFGGTEWISKTYFEDPLKDMNLRYLDYKIKLEESTLIEQYPLDHLVFKNPFAIQKHGWVAFKSIYLDKQNVKLDVNRFRPTLVKALELLRQ